MQALLVPVGLDLFAVPMELVDEVVAAPLLFSLPISPAAILGLFNLRGEIVPMFDTAAVTGLGRLSAWPFAAVVRTSLGPAGLGATDLPEPATLGEQIGPSESLGTAGIYAVGRRLAVLIEVEALLASATIGAHVVARPGHEERG
jgi:purine-binding chemotaxis protein CheW